jgi:hypothetical protein
MHMDEKEKAEHEKAEQEYRLRHGECRAHRQGLADSRIWHCGWCCPPPPLSPRQITEIARIFRSAAPARPQDLDAWSLELTCGHLVRAQQHHSNGEYNVYGTRPCPECGGLLRGIITAARLGTLAEVAAPPRGALHADELEDLGSSLAIARRAVRQHEKAVERARTQVEHLEGMLDRSDSPGR